MTVIAATLTQMACDSMMSDNVVDFPSPKIYRHRGSLYGGAGNCDSLALFWEWLFDGRRKKKPCAPNELTELEDFTVMELCSDGLFIWGRQFLRMPVTRPIHAIGAGAQAAMAGLMCGKTLEEACGLACDIAPSTCARPIVVYDLVEAKKAVRRTRRAR
jgi:hypothetical protein